ncbi:DUF6085 family protein [Saccharothrix sp. HUAS TT1]|uniref:DUF6085 family protein n=1 Tax=unclassified Saccharothrix TaxID=2593673 RepID=UPI00345C4DBA
MQRAVDHARATYLAQTDLTAGTPIRADLPLTWMDVACLHDIAREFERQGDEADQHTADHQRVLNALLPTLQAHPLTTDEVQVKQGLDLRPGYVAEHAASLLTWYATELDRLNLPSDLQQHLHSAIRAAVNDSATDRPDAIATMAMTVIRPTLQRLTRERDEARAQLLALGADQTDHVIELNADRYGIQHPLTCRPSLFDCPVHHAWDRNATLDPPPAPGRYLATLDHDGWIVIGDQIHVDGQVTGA